MAPPAPLEAETAWSALSEELDRWAAAGREATFWWRDDDAADATQPLQKLATMAERAGAPLALAVVPQPMTAALVEYLATTIQISIVQHGFAHVNHARQKGKGAWELGVDRPPPIAFAELADGFAKLQNSFADRFVPLIVPPWNRIHETITKGLPAIGLHGLSTFGPRLAANPAPGVTQINAHCDPVKWKGGPHFTGTARAIDDILTHLRDRRSGQADTHEPTGLLTHHLELDAACWGFVEEVLAHITDHRAARWLPIGELIHP